MPEKEFLTGADLERAGIAKRQTLAKWRLLGEGPKWYKLRGGTAGAVRYRLSDVEKWLADCAQKSRAGGAAA